MLIISFLFPDFEPKHPFHFDWDPERDRVRYRPMDDNSQCALSQGHFLSTNRVFATLQRHNVNRWGSIGR